MDRLSWLFSSPLGDFWENIFGSNGDKGSSSGSINNSNCANEDDDEVADEMSLSSFQQELMKRQQQEEPQLQQHEQLEEANASNFRLQADDFDGYCLRDAIYNKYGECFDVDFQRVDSYGFRSVYLVSNNLMRRSVVDMRSTAEFFAPALFLSHIIYFFFLFCHIIVIQNILPFRLGGKRFRHETEYDYLCHLQAVVSLCFLFHACIHALDLN